MDYEAHRQPPEPAEPDRAGRAESRRSYEREKIEPALREAEHLAALVKARTAEGGHLNRRVTDHLAETARLLRERRAALQRIEERLERRTGADTFRQAASLHDAGYRVRPVEGHPVEWPVGSGNFNVNDGWEGFALYGKDGRTVLAEWQDAKSEEAHAAGEILSRVPEQRDADKDNPYSVLMFLQELSEEE